MTIVTRVLRLSFDVAETSERTKDMGEFSFRSKLPDADRPSNPQDILDATIAARASSELFTMNVNFPNKIELVVRASLTFNVQGVTTATLSLLFNVLSPELALVREVTPLRVVNILGAHIISDSHVITIIGILAGGAYKIAGSVVTGATGYELSWEERYFDSYDVWAAKNGGNAILVGNTNSPRFAYD